MMLFQFSDFKKPKPFKPYVYEPEPKDWAALDSFPKAQKLIVEVGSGKGDWILNEAKKNPEIFYIGIERTTNKSKSMLLQSAQHKLANLITMQADAISLINQKFPKKAVDELFFFYPNPTPKKRQANQRFFVGSCFEVFDQVLKAHGLITLVTNIEPYFREAESFLTKIWGYTVLSSGRVPDDLEPRTAFEKKYKKKGETLFELTVRKG